MSHGPFKMGQNGRLSRFCTAQIQWSTPMYGVTLLLSDERADCHQQPLRVSLAGNRTDIGSCGALHLDDRLTDGVLLWLLLPWARPQPAEAVLHRVPWLVLHHDAAFVQRFGGSVEQPLAC